VPLQSLLEGRNDIDYWMGKIYKGLTVISCFFQLHVSLYFVSKWDEMDDFLKVWWHMVHLIFSNFFYKYIQFMCWL